MIYPLRNNRRFKQENLANWLNNTEFWLQGDLPHIGELRAFLSSVFARVACPNRETCFYDFGCGEAWILRLLIGSRLRWRYLGIDFNDRIVAELQAKYKDANVAFQCKDIESRLPSSLLNEADVAVGCLSLFEMPRLDLAVKNIAKCVRGAGYFICVNIDPLTQLLAISPTLKAFRGNLERYQRYGCRLAYDKRIQTTHGRSRRTYKGILYSHQAILRAAMTCEFTLVEYADILALLGPMPQIYQVFVFRKGKN